MFLLLLALGAPPAPTPMFTVENKVPAFAVVSKVRETVRASDGTVYVKGADGFYRKETVASERPTFSDPDAAHRCPKCGGVQKIVLSFNRDGSHNHRCPVDGYTWTH